MRLSPKVVDLGRHDLGDDRNEVGSVGQVTIVKNHLGSVICEKIARMEAMKRGDDIKGGVSD